MLDRIFLQIFDMSKVAAIVILAVLLVRLCLRRAPKNEIAMLCVGADFSFWGRSEGTDWVCFGKLEPYALDNDKLAAMTRVEDGWIGRRPGRITDAYALVIQDGLSFLFCCTNRSEVLYGVFTEEDGLWFLHRLESTFGRENQHGLRGVRVQSGRIRLPAGAVPRLRGCSAGRKRYFPLPRSRSAPSGGRNGAEADIRRDFAEKQAHRKGHPRVAIRGRLGKIGNRVLLKRPRNGALFLGKRPRRMPHLAVFLR